ncbi:hypothetical protein TELCIR_17006 [Teladorsagia circumcincta]|uniref:Serine/threonine specific protein phosphatases domain-containing protein n=1 Tax=Teladorsagia circumcincta TaxID=45464 RepID=A0A2G9TTY7_TELCI|nr:hypothetical protein TELCIR_17006 [Teladorsagia circumcincta]
MDARVGAGGPNETPIALGGLPQEEKAKGENAARCVSSGKIILAVYEIAVVQDGYEFFADRHLVTIFSAPNYCGQFDNTAAVMLVNKELNCTFTLHKPILKKAPA